MDKAAGRDDAVRITLREAVASLEDDGEVIDCDRTLAARFLSRAWHNVHAEKATQFRSQADHLVRKLSDILRAAFVHSQAGQQPEALKSGFGALHDSVFDFAAMSRLVARNVPQDELPPQRRQRIEWALGVLREPAVLPRSGPTPAPKQHTGSSSATARRRSRRTARACRSWSRW